jgi:hydrogenase expression/formation protein HypE
MHTINTKVMNEYISLDHGAGGDTAGRMIRSVFTSRFGMPDTLTDSAVLPVNGDLLSFTTDSYVVDPLFFPGGNIGRLAVCGTVNDLAVSGAVPQYLSASFIIEEGFPLSDLITIAQSMSDEAINAGVKIVTGDTKVVGKGKCDKLFITTSGMGLLQPHFRHISSGSQVRPGDTIIINGSLGSHAVAVLGAREKLTFSSQVNSDVASLNHLIFRVLKECKQVRFMRDLTRGGLAAVLNELAAMISSGIEIFESAIPVDEPVRGICEILGFEPLYMANEGKIVLVIGKEEQERAIEIMRSDPLGRESVIIGEIIENEGNLVILQTASGGRRIIDMPSGIQLPRIC